MKKAWILSWIINDIYLWQVNIGHDNKKYKIFSFYFIFFDDDYQA